MLGDARRRLEEEPRLGNVAAKFVEEGHLENSLR